MEKLKQMLATYGKRTIALTELEHLLKSHVHSYEEFAEQILQLEKDSILEMVKSKGRTLRSPSLAYQYRINKNLLTHDFHLELQTYHHQLHSAILLDYYFSKDPKHWKEDLPYILKIDRYLKQNGFPTDLVPAPERSFEIVGDEKWITEKGGKELLERIHMFDKLSIIPISEPIMFAINPNHIQEKVQYHLIVENKTTYQGLLPALLETSFSTLIYGSGKTIIKSIEQFENQYPVKAIHHFFYFGDIDREGIAIWYMLAKKINVVLAMPFYRECLKLEAVKGKEYQKEHAEAMGAFLNDFSEKEQEKIVKLLQDGYYYPQEILKAKQLQSIWRESDWKTLI